MIAKDGNETWTGRRPTLVGAALLLLLAGCVERRLTIRSDPPNALVVLDGQEIGHTPVSQSFQYYGDRQVRLVKDGYETKVVNQRLSTPWWQIPPLDFFADILPYRIRDERSYVYGMEPAMMVGADELRQRAEAVRVDGQNPPPDALRRAGVAPAAQ